MILVIRGAEHIGSHICAMSDRMRCGLAEGQVAATGCPARNLQYVISNVGGGARTAVLAWRWLLVREG